MTELRESNDLTFTAEEFKQIRTLVWKDKEFTKNYMTIRNAWLLQKISTKSAVKLIKEELEKAPKEN